MKKNSPSYVPVMESMPDRLRPMYGRYAQTGQVPTGITDVLTIGEEATVFRPVQRALRPTGWAVSHAGSLEAALEYLESNVAAVAVTEAEVAGDDWESIVPSLRDLRDSPEIVVLTWRDLPLQQVIETGAFDMVARPFNHSDLLWAVATAWHKWMSRLERGAGGGLCSDA